MAEWVRLCSLEQAPAPGEAKTVEVAGQQVCLANIDGELHAVDNVCPHRGGPLGEGWVEGQSIVCPWHAWSFDLRSGLCVEPESAKVKVFLLRMQGDAVEVEAE